MRATFKPSLASRTSTRALIVACLPAATIAFVANSPALASAFGDLTVNDKAVANPKAPNTNVISNTTNSDSSVPICIQGVRG